ncbi:hypothetical protein [Pseudomonas cichorii]|uniref:HTH cro/C1-type domain-containing protein n=1 Tax=Pseudomonas cichorii TaxID=36746 RepID=A0A3M4VSQ1_PSECI|nr:hypothetical protein [Pseudomonas cichorii]RMR54673.1 hypothetical protein ALP84_200066 [Pseudomonas cichorii]
MAVLLQIASTKALSITSEEREFLIALGERIARLRKEHGITQTQLAPSRPSKPMSPVNGVFR